MPERKEAETRPVSTNALRPKQGDHPSRRQPCQTPTLPTFKEILPDISALISFFLRTHGPTTGHTPLAVLIALMLPNLIREIRAASDMGTWWWKSTALWLAIAQVILLLTQLLR